mmetsp:Transcript_117088/g.331378  ORF Transcript_117088/g.331378 Transcript_117088/m.331378 type:complete len:220 (+) Transcript_117088:62-721(+)|eukprot:CAMPEP_0117529940 /NCGR_PEP_ID=MMETSP0784-20121206/38087_1 /TAXON_ID=39447 /ORGANISM="" /LENGTH=219 /DNA_ID=CAMNT_0005326269 /DNA_START=62 /DNA_END=721 /DNA_ORIENTATION=-
MSQTGAVANEEEALQALVDGHEDFEFLRSNTKVRCKSTGHEMPPRFKVVSEYLNGAKYKKLKEWYSVDFTQYEPHIVQHPELKKHLLCKLTNTTIPMNPDKVQAHVGSKRYKNFLKEHEEGARKKAEKKERIRSALAKRKRMKAASPEDGKATSKDVPSEVSAKPAKKRPERSIKKRRKNQQESKTGEEASTQQAKKQPEGSGKKRRKNQQESQAEQAK